MRYTVCRKSYIIRHDAIVGDITALMCCKTPRKKRLSFLSKSIVDSHLHLSIVKEGRMHCTFLLPLICFVLSSEIKDKIIKKKTLGKKYMYMIKTLINFLICYAFEDVLEFSQMHPSCILLSMAVCELVECLDCQGARC